MYTQNSSSQNLTKRLSKNIPAWMKGESKNCTDECSDVSVAYNAHGLDGRTALVGPPYIIATWERVPPRWGLTQSMRVVSCQTIDTEPKIVPIWVGHGARLKWSPPLLDAMPPTSYKIEKCRSLQKGPIGTRAGKDTKMWLYFGWDLMQPNVRFCSLIQCHKDREGK